ncbi:MAG: N-acetylmuramoyl-L-alanine amidase [Sediminibacterium sp.]|nr:N-acetylmuramoyl-L-alanine amidase [Sediminibacterium sp.]MDP1811206.1 N-acetylmuramoyl-L-alanine amidase [Sediminibacterium sp.]MDP3128706.1 N-acetylmuramoyl-L-alanine amidase [Sediminibacterium sp.]MDP3666646.1 N-acetylmuramoyl-L-alanine amidase [Sediminibacterium sp.]
MKLPLLACLLLIVCQSGAQITTTPYLLARSTGKLPALAYGLGEDRLGGAKMGYIDTNILLRVIDSAENRYQVQLSRYHSAYIDKSFIKPDSAQIEKSFYLTNSFMAKGDSAFDYVSISMEERLPYKTYMEINPSKIVVEIFGVHSNTNWITQLQSLQEVKNVYYNQVEDDVVRVTIELQHRQHWGYSIGYKGKVLQVKIKRQPAKTDIRYLTIAIDAGHGGTNAGAGGSVAMYQEKQYTLLFARALQKYLRKKGVKKLIMTRTTDTTFDNKDRILFLQQQNPDYVISLHLNSSGNTEINGVSTYYKHIGFRPLTVTLLKRMRELKLNEFGNVGNFNFALNTPTDFPNSLLEIAFLSNEDDEKKIIKPKFQEDVAKKIYLGIVDWLKLVK